MQIAYPYLKLFWMILCSWSIAFPLSASGPSSPTHVVQNLMQAISSFKTSESGTLSATKIARNAAAAEQANTILDIPSLSRRILGPHWKQRTTVEQQEFTTLLTTLFINVAYPQSSKFFSDLDVQIQDERIMGAKAIVRTMVSDPKEGLISVDYRLHKTKGTWHVRDIILDDVSLTRNLRSQCQKIIKQYSYSDLLRRIQKKLDKE